MAKETVTERLFSQEGIFVPKDEAQEEPAEVGQPKGRSALAFVESLKETKATKGE